MSVVIYTDGGCHGNPGPGAWAFVLSTDDERITRSGGDPATTNNRMELRAVIQALAEVRNRGLDGPVEIYTDSQYVRNGITSWISTWMANGWRTSAKKPVKNKELWETLHDLAGAVTPHWHWVRGHSGNELNEVCDSLVQEAIGQLERPKA